MRLGVLVAILAFIGFYLLFWNIKKWKWSVTKVSLTALICAVVSGSVVGGLIYILQLIG